MKSFYLLLISGLFMVSCQNSEKQKSSEAIENSLFTENFRNYKELNVLEDYEKVTDTSIDMGTMENNYRLMKLRENSNNLILFYKVVDRDSIVPSKYSYRAIDTLNLKDLQEDERITIGYCFKEGFFNQEVIAVVKNNDSLYVTGKIRAWRANPETEKIEELQDLEDIECFNEFFEGEKATIPVEKIS